MGNLPGNNRSEHLPQIAVAPMVDLRWEGRHRRNRGIGSRWSPAAYEYELSWGCKTFYGTSRCRRRNVRIHNGSSVLPTVICLGGAASKAPVRARGGIHQNCVPGHRLFPRYARGDTDSLVLLPMGEFVWNCATRNRWPRTTTHCQRHPLDPKIRLRESSILYSEEKTMAKIFLIHG
ncbi:unnamed protein product [Pseudo-nitzschia multistriata]|uniref:Uncharacterized protein n=1 Tax=Pseudo-nitzschia multistriata TaxID=183589 RepID=A0A448Z2Y4_9STRA|nr:unnamed protein product [Pseudo-nitzschia multistriata]